MKQLVKLHNGMTPESLKFVIKCILDGCLEKIQSGLPPEMPRSHREALLIEDGQTSINDMLDWENGIVAQTLGSISIIVAQSIGDGIGDGDVDQMLGNWNAACAMFVSDNWTHEGTVKARWDAVKDSGGDHISKILVNFPDTEAAANLLIDGLAIIERE